jgi:hypothetical protein
MSTKNLLHALEIHITNYKQILYNVKNCSYATGSKQIEGRLN